MMRNMPVGQSKEQLLMILDDIRQGVESGDTLEGSIEFLMPVPMPCDRCRGAGWFVEGEPLPNEARGESVVCPDCEGSGRGPLPDLEPDFMVQASYRIGNTMGQGGVRMIGEMKEVPDGA